ncbi:hypothetical protein ACIQMR_03650 [Streptomyces sp. NPDC091376]|uniref:hypothetical protein n=1 Tax=Streptomyces sp. NPDC091376 TaxID=3365994 RepID=UPI0038086DC3
MLNEVPSGFTESLSPQKSDALMAEFPEDDPEAVLRLIRERSIPTRVTSAVRKTQSQRDYDEIVEVLAGAPAATVDQRRNLYRVITGLDGATNPVPTTDGIGRKVIAVGVEGNQRDYAWQRNTYQVLLDPETYAYRGARVVAGMGYYVGGKASGGPFVAKGTVIATVTRQRTEIVDDRPSSFSVERGYPSQWHRIDVRWRRARSASPRGGGRDGTPARPLPTAGADRHLRPVRTGRALPVRFSS